MGIHVSFREGTLQEILLAALEYANRNWLGYLPTQKYWTFFQAKVGHSGGLTFANVHPGVVCNGLDIWNSESKSLVYKVYMLIVAPIFIRY